MHCSRRPRARVSQFGCPHTMSRRGDRSPTSESTARRGYHPPMTPNSVSGPSHNLPELVVAIGGSAGALPAFERLCHSLPEHLGAAYLVVQHNKPELRTVLPELLGRACSLPVVTIA